MGWTAGDRFVQVNAGSLSIQYPWSVPLGNLRDFSKKNRLGENQICWGQTCSLRVNLVEHSRAIAGCRHVRSSGSFVILQSVQTRQRSHWGDVSNDNQLKIETVIRMRLS